MKPFASDKLEDVIHARGRLNILAYLNSVGTADFMTLRNEVALQSGSIAQHLKKLEEAGYVEVTKELLPGSTRTTACISEAGRKALKDYVVQLKELLNRGGGLLTSSQAG